MTITLPHASEAIITRVLERCSSLIKHGYWDNISLTKLNAWFNNFDTAEERYLAITILDSLIFRNNNAVVSFGANIFQILLPQLLDEFGVYKINSISSWLDVISSKRCRELPFRFSTIENVDSKPAKSGGTIYRTLAPSYFNKDLGVNCSNLSAVPSHVKSIIFFDDMLGSGQQFSSFVNKFDLDNLGKIIFYIPLTALKRSVELLNDKYKNIIISPVEVIDENYSFFSRPNPLISHNEKSTHSDFLVFYNDFCEQKNIACKNRIGFDNNALTYTFSDSTPNNNLALLWYKSKEWHNLFSR